MAGHFDEIIFALLQPFLVIDINTGAYKACEFSCYGKTWYTIVGNQPVLSIKTPEPVFCIETFFIPECIFINFNTFCFIIGMNSLEPSFITFLLQRMSAKLKPCFIEIIIELISSRHPDHGWYIIRHGLKQFNTVF